MSKTLWHTIQIKVPAEMLELTKAGKVSIKKTLTKTFNISKSQKKPAIKLIPADINKPQIVNDGKEWNVEELKSQMVKANALAKKNKGRDITKSEKRVSKLEKFKKAVVDSAREGVKKNIDKKYDELINSVKKMKSIKLKETPPEDDNIIKIGSLINPNPTKGRDTSKLGWNSKAALSANAASYYKNIIDYYWDNAYKEMEPQPIPTKEELENVSRILFYLTPKFYRVKGVIRSTSSVFPSESLDQLINSITLKQHKIIMKIAYNDSINKNHKYLYKACKMYKTLLDDEEKARLEKKASQEKVWGGRTPKQIEAQKKFTKSLILKDSEMLD